MLSINKKKLMLHKIQHEIKNLFYGLDSPKHNEILTSPTSSITITGWALFKNKPVEVILSMNGEEYIYTCDTARQDVVSNFKVNLNRDVENNCGFSISVSSLDDAKIGFIINGSPVWIANLQLTSEDVLPKILFGQDGHLFLDNDTNKSVEQFTGKRLISNEAINQWGLYFSKIEEYAKKNNIEYIFTLAPAKELVYPTLYPHKKSAITPVEQFLVKFSPFNILYPANQLYEAGDISYSKLDSHWTDYGAGIVVSSIFEHFGIRVNSHFPFPFKVQKQQGDLGCKMPNPFSQDLLKADFSIARKNKNFDNKITNRGGIQIYENNKSPLDSKIVIFGDSFSVNMVPYLAMNFRKVVHVFSGARIDYNILDHESPDYVICEITTRFLISPPELTYSVSDDCNRKLSSMQINEKDSFINDLFTTNNQRYNFYLNKTLFNTDIKAN